MRRHALRRRSSSRAGRARPPPAAPAVAGEPDRANEVGTTSVAAPATSAEQQCRHQRAAVVPHRCRVDRVPLALDGRGGPVHQERHRRRADHGCQALQWSDAGQAHQAGCGCQAEPVHRGRARSTPCRRAATPTGCGGMRRPESARPDAWRPGRGDRVVLHPQTRAAEFAEPAELGRFDRRLPVASPKAQRRNSSTWRPKASGYWNRKPCPESG